MNAATNATPTATAPEFTVCALVRTYTQTSKVSRWDAATQTSVSEGERTETIEAERLEFLPLGADVLIRHTERRSGVGGHWELHTRAQAREIYKAHVEGRGWYRGTWTAAPAQTVLLGAVDLPAQRVDYQWGETAWMYTMADVPAARAPMLKIGNEVCAPRAFSFVCEGRPRRAVYWARVAG